MSELLPQEQAISILIVDDEPDICFTLEGILEDAGYHVTTANNAVEAKEAMIANKPGAILLDIWMPDLDGTSLVKEWAEQGAIPCPIIMMSGHATYESVVESIKHGAVAFLEKPLTSSEVLHVVDDNIRNYELKQEIKTLKRSSDESIELIGSSEVYETMRQALKSAAEVHSPVLLCGEIGTDKRSIARYIHDQSDRAAHSFTEFNPVELNAEALANTLFGNEAGNTIHYGKLEIANQGTLFLGEIMNLPLQHQERLATLMETGHLIRNNGVQEVPIDVRLVASSRYNLQQGVKDGKLNEALMYHLNILQITIPSLRDHLEDVPDLVKHYVKHYTEVEQLPYRKFTMAAINRLRQHHWPGNIRELKNLIQRLLINADSVEINLEAVDAAINLSPNDTITHFSEIPLHLPLKEAREAFEREYFLRQFRMCDRNVAKLADKVGMERTNLYRKLRSLDIDPKTI